MNTSQSFGLALRKIRKSRGLTQEDFSEVSSRTYVSTLERGIKGPTLEKVEILAKEIGIHPLSILALTYMDQYNDINLNVVIETIKSELQEFIK